MTQLKYLWKHGLYELFLPSSVIRVTRKKYDFQNLSTSTPLLQHNEIFISERQLAGKFSDYIQCTYINIWTFKCHDFLQMTQNLINLWYKIDMFEVNSYFVIERQPNILHWFVQWYVEETELQTNINLFLKTKGAIFIKFS